MLLHKNHQVFCKKKQTNFCRPPARVQIIICSWFLWINSICCNLQTVPEIVLKIVAYLAEKPGVSTWFCFFFQIIKKMHCKKHRKLFLCYSKISTWVEAGQKIDFFKQKSWLLCNSKRSRQKIINRLYFYLILPRWK